MVVDLIRSRAALWTLRQQINILRRTAPKKFLFSGIDRLLFVGLYWLFPKVYDALADRGSGNNRPAGIAPGQNVLALEV